MTASGTTDAAAAVIVTAFGSVLMLFACLAALVARLVGASAAPHGPLREVEIEEPPFAARASV